MTSCSFLLIDFSGERNIFLMSCWEILDPHWSHVPFHVYVLILCIIARHIPCRSIPSCSQKRWSSIETIASMIVSGMSSYFIYSLSSIKNWYNGTSFLSVIVDHIACVHSLSYVTSGKSWKSHLCTKNHPMIHQISKIKKLILRFIYF